MRFAQFYHRSTGWNGRDCTGPREAIPKCGSDSVLPFDGRWGMARCLEAARVACHTYGHVGFTVEEGETYTRSRVVRDLEVVNPV